MPTQQDAIAAALLAVAAATVLSSPFFAPYCGLDEYAARAEPLYSRLVAGRSLFEGAPGVQTAPLARVLADNQTALLPEVEATALLGRELVEHHCPFVVRGGGDLEGLAGSLWRGKYGRRAPPRRLETQDAVLRFGKRPLLMAATTEGGGRVVVLPPLEEDRIPWERRERHPRFRQSSAPLRELPEGVEALQATLGPGDALYLPPLWWRHHPPAGGGSSSSWLAQRGVEQARPGLMRCPPRGLGW